MALHLASKLPSEVVKGLVLFSPVRPPPEAGRQALTARAETVRQSGMVAVVAAVCSNAFASESLSTRRAEVALAREMLTRQPSEGYALAVDALRNSAAPLWGSIRGNVIVVSGETDKVSTVAAGQATVADIGSHAQQVVLQKVGHWPMLEAPNESIDAIKQLAR